MTARRRRSVRLATAVSAVVCSALLGGCGAVPGTAADDETVTVMTWAPQDTEATNMPGMPAMAQAYARWVNSQGGVNGHRLRVLTCNDHNDTVRAARCAGRAKKAGVAAVVGSYSQHGRSFMPALESAGIPYIGGYGVADQEFTSPFSYPVNGGLPALVAGNGRQLAAGSCSHVSLVRPDTTVGDQLPRLINAGLADGGAGPVTDVRAPEGASEYTRQAYKALEGARTYGAAEPGAGTAGGNAAGGDTAGGETAGGETAGGETAAQGADAKGPCVTAVLGGRTSTFFESFRQLRKDSPSVRTASVLGSVRQSLVDQSGGPGSPLEGAFATGWYPPGDDPRWKPMKRVIEEHAFGDNRVDASDPGVQTTWIAFTVLRQVLKSLEPGEAVTAKSVRHALDQGEPVDTGGLTPKLNWNYGNMLAARDFPRIVNTMVTYQQVRDGRLKQVHDGFVDVERTLEAGASES
ncbi:ABC transporter substrate-binding protein [Streptomyces sp. HNM0575]|uniref:ABC transporter substrate-binding protein n=1 Tax=Streptomyces sp. HNM0575 TaxID=2716338 RepID=UPI00145CFC9D|nr:ABC transporter substrate-binding protein [Streptomyces sp. HNM0575]NLU75958.1 ABC transporter substrate-binding protein [Streptomyces sp. HNM0575]